MVAPFSPLQEDFSEYVSSQKRSQVAYYILWFIELFIHLFPKRWLSPCDWGVPCRHSVTCSGTSWPKPEPGAGRKATPIGSIWPWPFLGQRKTLETPPPHPNLLSQELLYSALFAWLPGGSLPRPAFCPRTLQRLLC